MSKFEVSDIITSSENYTSSSLQVIEVHLPHHDNLTVEVRVRSYLYSHSASSQREAKDYHFEKEA